MILWIVSDDMNLKDELTIANLASFILANIGLLLHKERMFLIAVIGCGIVFLYAIYCLIFKFATWNKSYRVKFVKYFINECVFVLGMALLSIVYYVK